jgi:hypothetical protein
MCHKIIIVLFIPNVNSYGSIDKMPPRTPVNRMYVLITQGPPKTKTPTGHDVRTGTFRHKTYSGSFSAFAARANPFFEPYGR